MYQPHTLLTRGKQFFFQKRNLTPNLGVELLPSVGIPGTFKRRYSFVVKFDSMPGKYHRIISFLIVRFISFRYSNSFPGATNGLQELHFWRSSRRSPSNRN